RLRLPVRLRRAAARGADGSRCRRAGAFRAAAVSRQSALYRQGTGLSAMMSPGPRQLALALGHAASLRRDDFLAGPSNAAALALVERWPDWPNRTMVLSGPEGAGKSHLAAIWGEMAGARFTAARALAGSDPPAALATGALVVEDLAPGRFDERAL